jgi:hypothetical protein
MRLKKVKEHKYFVVPQLKERENCVIVESKATFNQKDFAEEIKEQLSYLELTHEELAKMCYLSLDRVRSILSCKGRKITDAEIKEIRKKLSIT